MTNEDPTSLTSTMVFHFKDQKSRGEFIARVVELADEINDTHISGMSVDDELRRNELIAEAIERYDDHYDRAEVIEEILNISYFSDEKWDWDAFDKKMEGA